MKTTIKTNLTREEQTAVECAIGRILRMGSRPTQPGDIEEYNRCRGIVIDILGNVEEGYTPNYARDRLCGAAGD